MYFLFSFLICLVLALLMEFNGMKEIVQSFFPLWVVVLYFWKCALSKALIGYHLANRSHVIQPKTRLLGSPFDTILL
jgi:hypothetical protein